MTELFYFGSFEEEKVRLLYLLVVIERLELRSRVERIGKMTTGASSFSGFLTPFCNKWLRGELTTTVRYYT